MGVYPLIKPFQPEDLAQLKELQPQDWPPLEPIFNFYLDSPFCYTVKWDLQGVLAGTGVAVSYRDSAWLAHIIVHSRYRKQGIGRGMVAHLLEYLQLKGIPKVSLIATDLGYPVYLKEGFQVDSEYQVFQKDTLLIPQPSEHISPIRPEQHEELLKLDFRLCGEGREELLKPHLRQSLGYWDKDRLCGYYIPTLGEGCILAETEEAGLALIRQKCSAPFGRQVLPVENKKAVDFLETMGFQGQHRLKRMSWGRPVEWFRDSHYSRIGGNFG